MDQTWKERSLEHQTPNDQCSCDLVHHDSSTLLTGVLVQYAPGIIFFLESTEYVSVSHLLVGCSSSFHASAASKLYMSCFTAIEYMTNSSITEASLCFLWIFVLFYRVSLERSSLTWGFLNINVSGKTFHEQCINREIWDRGR